MFGSETWPTEKKDRMKLETADMWMWRKMTRTRWIHRKSSERILEEVGERRQLMESLK